jgi:HAD superfamily hydrolase (TIGR01509 family)
LAKISAVVFDFIGTLAEVKNYDYESSIHNLYKSLTHAGFDLEEKSFMKAYKEAHEKYRLIRYEKLIEVTNAVWISEALNKLNHKTTQRDPRIRTAVNIFFKQYLESIKPRRHAKALLTHLHDEYVLGLMSNFTYAPVIYAAVRKLDFSKYFNTILVSQSFGWRKPSPKIFNEMLRKLNVKPQGAVFVGDSPEEDIGGAQKVGIKTVFIPSQFCGLEDLENSHYRPTAVINDLRDLPKILLKISSE